MQHMKLLLVTAFAVFGLGCSTGSVEVSEGMVRSDDNEDRAIYPQLKTAIFIGETFTLDSALGGSNSGGDGRMWSEIALEEALSIVDGADASEIRSAIEKLYLDAEENEDMIAASVVARLDCQFQEVDRVQEMDRGIELLALYLVGSDRELSGNAALMLLDLLGSTQDDELRQRVLEHIREYHRDLPWRHR